MKLTSWLLSALAPLTALSLLAQPANPAPPPVPASAPAAEAAPAKPKAKARAKARHHPKAAAVVKNTIVLTPPVMAVVKDDVLNVRGQPSFTGEVIAHLKRGDTVTVLEEISKPSASKDEPSHWDRIVMPSNAPVWVDAAFIDAEKNVRARKINLRGGPGENYSVVGQLEKGTPVKEIRSAKGWLRIEAPTNAYAYVAAEYLEAAPQPAPVADHVTPPPASPPEVVNVPAQPAPVPAQEPLVAAATPAPAPAPAPVAPPPTQSEVDQELAALRKATIPDAGPVIPAAAATATPAPGAATDIPPRVVTREGFVHRAYNIQAPADFELHDIKTGVLLDYLQPSTQNFKIYVGTRVTVTGTEALVERWPRTPVLRIQTVDLMP